MSARSFGANLLGALARTDPQQDGGQTVVIGRTDNNLIAVIVDGSILEARDLVEQAGWEFVTACVALTPDTLRMMTRRQR